RREDSGTPHRLIASSPHRYFRDVTAGSGLAARGPYDWTTSAAWCDVDGDGWLDLYVCRYVQFTPASPQFCSPPTLDRSHIRTACSPNEYPPQRGSLYHNERNGRFGEDRKSVV